MYLLQRKPDEVCRSSNGLGYVDELKRSNMLCPCTVQAKIDMLIMLYNPCFS
jgi:hypothetical protein